MCKIFICTYSTLFYTCTYIFYVRSLYMYMNIYYSYFKNKYNPNTPTYRNFIPKRLIMSSRPSFIGNNTYRERKINNMAPQTNLPRLNIQFRETNFRNAKRTLLMTPYLLSKSFAILGFVFI